MLRNNEYYNEFPNLSKSLVNGLDESNLVIKVRINSLYGDNYASYQQDGLHPNQEGYNLFKQLILENIDL